MKHRLNTNPTLAYASSAGSVKLKQKLLENNARFTFLFYQSLAQVCVCLLCIIIINTIVIIIIIMITCNLQITPSTIRPLRQELTLNKLNFPSNLT